MKFLVFGTGEYYGRFKKWISNEDIVALLDNSPEKQHKLLDGVEILSPEEGITREYDVVIVMSFYIKEMKKQLLNLGVDEDKIFHFYDLRKLIRVEEKRQPIQFCGITQQEMQEKAGEIIGLLSTDLTFGGTAIALFYMAKVLKKHGYFIVFASMIDGPLRASLEDQGIPVIIDSNLQLATMCETEWVADFRLVICNANSYYIFLSERDSEIPTIWWLHDSAFFYDGVDREILRNISQKNLTVFSVGPIPEAAIRGIVPELPVKRLLYGVEDCVGSRAICGDISVAQRKICFVTIGFVEERKGQDILLQAARLLEKEIREQAVFYLIGQNTSLLATQIMEAVEQVPEIVVTGPVDREGIDRALRAADVMICPSREDPMPTVVAEAMSYSVPCIVSDAVGTTEYITEKENGLIFRSEDAEMLADKIRWCMENRPFLGEMGIKARQTYETVFSMETFEKQVCDMISRSLDM